MAPKHPSSVDNTSAPSSTSPTDAPTLTTIMAVLDCLTTDIQGLALAVSNTNTAIDTKIVSVSNLLGTLCTEVTGNLQSLHSEFSTKIDTIYVNVDSSILSACSEWKLDLDSSLAMIRSEWSTTLTATESSLNYHIQDSSLHFGTMVDDIVDKISTLENLRISDPQVLHLLNDATLDHIRNLTLSSAIDEAINRAVSTEISQLSQEIQALKNTTTSFPNNLKKTGFAQNDSKDFSISKFVKDLERIALTNDLLQAYEHFWDSILHAFNNICTENQVFPYCKDLKKDFDFKSHLCANPRLNPSELIQVKLNYRSFGDTLRLYLLTPSTVPKTTCPKAFIKFLSLKSIKDGFKLLREFIFQLSPQLDGIFINFTGTIISLTIINGEHISEFYSQVQDLSHEIHLANLPDGNAATLHYQFLSLLHQTGCPTILGITQPYWAKITTFHHNPNHYTITKLPRDLHGAFSELEASDVGILKSCSSTFTPTSFVHDDYNSNNNAISPIVTFGASFLDDNNQSPIATNLISSSTIPIAALGDAKFPNNNNKNNITNNNICRHLSQPGHLPLTKNKTFEILHTSDGRRFLSEQSTSTRPHCFML